MDFEYVYFIQSLIGMRNKTKRRAMEKATYSTPFNQALFENLQSDKNKLQTCDE